MSCRRVGISAALLILLGDLGWAQYYPPAHTYSQSRAYSPPQGYLPEALLPPLDPDKHSPHYAREGRPFQAMPLRPRLRNKGAGDTRLRGSEDPPQGQAPPEHSTVRDVRLRYQRNEQGYYRPQGYESASRPQGHEPPSPTARSYGDANEPNVRTSPAPISPSQLGSEQLDARAGGFIPSDPREMAALPPDMRARHGETKSLPLEFRRTLVDYYTKEPAGTIIIDTPNTYLYLVLGAGKALRYGIGVGREGFTWAGTERVSKMAEWPDWHPPAEMIERQPYLPRFMAGGEGNPLGARALYLGKTLYRIHGTNQPSTIGKYVSSGCIRLLNEDIEDLYRRVNLGTRVVVLNGDNSASTGAARAALMR